MPEIEDSSDIEELGPAKYWLDAIMDRQKALKSWHDRAWKVIERYRDEERKRYTGSRFNILYANTRILKPALYAKSPMPDVRRRYSQDDPISKAVAEIIERALSYHMEMYDFDSMMKAVVEDYTLPGLGVAIAGYEAEYGETVVPREPVEPDGFIPNDFGLQDPTYPEGTMFDENEMPYREGEPFKPVENEYVSCSYWFWEDFVFGAARKWEDVPWEAFRTYMTREELRDLTPLADDVELDYCPGEGTKEAKKKAADEYKRATVWKVWDKKERKVRYVSPGLPQKELKVEDDPLGLQGFFPNPKPIISVRTNESLIPIPFFCIYQDQADELDAVTSRITMLTKKLQAKGIYNSVHQKAMSMLDGGNDGDLVPVPVHSADNLNMNNMVAYWPIERIASVIAGLYQQREQVKATLYEINGISDIVRGSTDPDETLGAQKIKSNYAGLSLQDMQAEVQRFARDMLRIKAEIIAEHFSADTLKAMVGEQLFTQTVQTPQGPMPMDMTDQIMQLMRDDRLRSYRIDIETDSTIQPNAQEEQKNMTELVSSITQMVTAWAPLVGSGQVPADVPKTLMLAAVRRFKGVREVEAALEQIGQPQQQQQQGPSEQETELQMHREKLETDIQMNREDNQTELMKKRMDVQADATLKSMEPMGVA